MHGDLNSGNGYSRTRYKHRKQNRKKAAQDLFNDFFHTVLPSDHQLARQFYARYIDIRLKPDF